MRKPVSYLQTDARWANVAYNHPGGSGSTIYSAGCGPTAAAMVVASLKDASVTPKEACQWAVDHGYRVYGGTANGFFVPYLAAYGIQSEYLDEYTYHNSSHPNHETVKKALQSGNWVIANPGPGRWTRSGHFILAYGYQDGYVYINDPASTAANRLKAEWSDFVYDQKCYWIVTVDGSTPPADPPKDVTESAKNYTATVTPSIGLNVRSGPGTQYSIVGGLAKGTKITVVAESGSWAKIGNNQWVCKDYISTSGKTESFNGYDAVVTPSIGLNIRSGPGTGYKIVRAVTKGTVLHVTGKSGNWLRVGTDEWASAEYLVKKGSGSVAASPEYNIGQNYTLKVTVKVRTGAGTKYAQKKHSQLTADGQKHDSTKTGCLDKGTVLTVQDLAHENGNVWVKCPSGWIAAYYGGSVYLA